MSHYHTPYQTMDEATRVRNKLASFDKLDLNQDQKLSADELKTALDARPAAAAELAKLERDYHESWLPQRYAYIGGPVAALAAGAATFALGGGGSLAIIALIGTFAAVLAAVPIFLWPAQDKVYNAFKDKLGAFFQG